MAERHLGLVDQPFDGRGTRGLRRAGQGNVAFAGQQPRGRVQADPAGARQEDLAPGVQIGEVDFGAAGAVERLDVGRQLDQVTRHEARGQAAVAQQLHQKPARVAARTRAQGQRLFGRLHARFHADQVAHIVLHLLVDLHQEVDGAFRRAIDLIEVGLYQRCGRCRLTIRRKFLGQRFVVDEGVGFRRGLEEKIEGVVDGHLGDEIHRDLELAGLFREDQASHVVGERILLPVDEMARRLDLEGVGNDLAAAMGRRSQPDDLWPQIDQSVVPVMRDVV